MKKRKYGTTMILRVPDEVHMFIKKEAKVNFCSMNHMVVTYLIKMIKEIENNSKKDVDNVE